MALMALAACLLAACAPEATAPSQPASVVEAPALTVAGTELPPTGLPPVGAVAPGTPAASAPANWQAPTIEESVTFSMEGTKHPAEFGAYFFALTEAGYSASQIELADNKLNGAGDQWAYAVRAANGNWLWAREAATSLWSATPVQYIRDETGVWRLNPNYDMVEVKESKAAVIAFGGQRDDVTWLVRKTVKLNGVEIVAEFWDVTQGGWRTVEGLKRPVADRDPNTGLERMMMYNAQAGVMEAVTAMTIDKKYLIVAGKVHGLDVQQDEYKNLEVEADGLSESEGGEVTMLKGGEPVKVANNSGQTYEVKNGRWLVSETESYSWRGGQWVAETEIDRRNRLFEEYCGKRYLRLQNYPTYFDGAPVGPDGLGTPTGVRLSPEAASVRTIGCLRDYSRAERWIRVAYWDEVDGKFYEIKWKVGYLGYDEVGYTFSDKGIPPVNDTGLTWGNITIDA